MANMVILAVENDERLWLVDLEGGTVSPFDATGGTPLAQAVELRRRGVSISKGVSLAIAVDKGPEAFSGFMDT